MIELYGHGGLVFYAIQVSPGLVMTMTPAATEHPASVVSAIHLRAAGWSYPSFGIIFYVSDFAVEFWWLR